MMPKESIFVELKLINKEKEWVGCKVKYDSGGFAYLSVYQMVSECYKGTLKNASVIQDGNGKYVLRKNKGTASIPSVQYLEDKNIK